MSEPLFDLPPAPLLEAPELPQRTVEAPNALPVARVLADVPFSFPDLSYDYLVPDKLDEQARVGTRVRVPFGRGRVTAVILERRATTDAARLRPIEKVLGIPVLTEEIAALIEELARDHICSRHDVLRMAVPPRHARGEKSTLSLPAPSFPEVCAGEEKPELAEVGERILACARADAVAADAARGALRAGGRALIVVPTGADIARVTSELQARLPGEPIARLAGEDSPETRYRHFISVLTGRARIVVGTRLAAYAPMEKLRVMIILDECNGALRDKHSPYLWADEVLRRRLTGERTLLRLSFPARMEAPTAPRAIDRTGWPTVSVAEQWSGAQVGVLPDAVFQLLRANETALISAPRPGYVPVLACESCAAKAVCPTCGLPMAVPEPGTPAMCRACGERIWRCPCGGQRLRALARGSDRLAQEIGRAFPGRSVEVVRTRGARTDADIVIATPGAEPERIFSCGVILDAAAPLATLSLNAENEAIARWARVARQIDPAGHLVLAGGAPPELADALARLGDSYRTHLLAEREALGQPPFHRWFAVSGQRVSVDELLGQVGARLADGSAPRASLGDLLGGGRQVFSAGIFLLGPTGSPEDTRVFLHEKAPAARLSGALRDALQSMKRPRVRVEADPQL